MSNIINIGGTSGGGGSSVVPNPQGTATDTLTKLGIEGTIYDFAGGGSTHNYSTTEQVVGAWVDGKTVYEKTFTTSNTIPFGSWGNLDDLTSLNIETVVNIEGVLRFNEDGDSIYRQYTTGISFGLMYNENSKYVMGRQGILSQTGGKNFTTHYTIRYTKATA